MQTKSAMLVLLCLLSFAGCTKSDADREREAAETLRNPEKLRGKQKKEKIDGRSDQALPTHGR